jgi:hypothetical protein
LRRIFVETSSVDYKWRIAVLDALSKHKVSEETVLMVLDEGYNAVLRSVV